MCSDHEKNRDDHKSSHVRGAKVLSVRVDDMTCGHCAGTIKKAIESTLPGTTVDADPATKLVKVTGSSDLERLHEIVTSAGYTPSAERAHA